MDLWRRGITRRKDVPIKYYKGKPSILQEGNANFPNFPRTFYVFSALDTAVQMA